LPAEPATVAELVDRIQVAWATLMDVVSPLSEAQLVTAGPPDGWAVKDHLVHIADWERATTFVLRREPQSLGLGVDPPPDDVDALNAIMYERSRALSLDEVTERARVAHAELLAEIHKLSDADLPKTRAEYGPEPDLTDRTIIGKIAGDTYEHYADHTVWIGDLLRALE
jgi:hypothetical protein